MNTPDPVTPEEAERRVDACRANPAEIRGCAARLAYFHSLLWLIEHGLACPRRRGPRRPVAGLGAVALAAYDSGLFPAAGVKGGA